MRFPIKEKDIIELCLEECEINSLYLTFQEFFEEEFESIEFYRKDNESGVDFLSKKRFYNPSGFIDKIEFYDSKGNAYKIIHFEKAPLEINAKSQATYSATKEIWRFNALGNLINVRGEYGNNYLLEYDADGNLESVDEGFQFKWENGEISALIDASNNSILQKVIHRSKLETIIEFFEKENKNIPRIRTYKYDNLGRLISVASGLSLTEIKYETKGNTKIQTTTTYVDNEQISFSSVTEKPITASKIEVALKFQEEKDSPMEQSRIVKNKYER